MISDVDRVILNFLRGEISKEDEKALNEWLDDNSANRELLDSISQIWKTSLGYPDIVNMDDERQKIWHRLNGDQDQTLQVYKRTKGHWFGRMIKYAAVLIVFFSFGYNLLVKYLQTQKPESPVLTEKIKRINPRGQKSRILLQDGSTVSLNAGSKLTYSTDFNKKSRDIYLEGEAYFEVVKNSKKPFKVYTDGLIITAIGTSFNVQAYTNDRIEKVALNTGKVKIETMNAIKRTGETFLNPGQMVVYDGEKKNLRMADFKGQDPFSWKDGKIVFYHASFEEVIEILSRWFNVDIKVKGELPREWDYSSSYENETLENILESLKFSEKINYSLSGSEVEIKI